jgi:hypothetical protein
MHALNDWGMHGQLITSIERKTRAQPYIPALVTILFSRNAHSLAYVASCLNG